jgi:hypothetical protein
LGNFFVLAAIAKRVSPALSRDGYLKLGQPKNARDVQAIIDKIQSRLGGKAE